MQRLIQECHPERNAARHEVEESTMHFKPPHLRRLFSTSCKPSPCRHADEGQHQMFLSGKKKLTLTYVRVTFWLLALRGAQKIKLRDSSRSLLYIPCCGNYFPRFSLGMLVKVSEPFAWTPPFTFTMQSKPTMTPPPFVLFTVISSWSPGITGFTNLKPSIFRST